MRIGVSVKMREGGYDRFGNEKYYKIKSHGFDCVDFDMCNINHPLYSLNDIDFIKHMQTERKLAEKAGIEIWQTHGPWPCPIATLKDAECPQNMQIMEKSILATQLLGSRYWVIHPLMPFGIDDIKKGLQDETQRINISFLKMLLEIAKSYNVTICIENTPFPNYSLATPEQILKLVRKINDTHLKICLDTGHVALFPELSIGDSIRQLGQEIKVFHIHDNSGKHDEHLYPFQGVIDWQNFSEAIKEIGFDGVLSLEIVPKETLATEDFEYESRILAEIAHTL